MELNGKIVSFLGDSITQGTGVNDWDNCRYDNRLKRMLGLKRVNNYGIGGTRLAHQRTPSDWPRCDLCFCGRAPDIDPESDLIVVFGGVNDYMHGDAPFGEMTDSTPATFCGGVDYLMRFLKEAFPKATIAFLTPAHMGGDGAPSGNPVKHPDAKKPLYDYCKVIMEKGEQYDIPVLSLYDELGIDPNDAEQSEKYTMDGLHFNDEGHKYLAECIGKFITEIKPRA